MSRLHSSLLLPSSCLAWTFKYCSAVAPLRDLACRSLLCLPDKPLLKQHNSTCVPTLANTWSCFAGLCQRPALDPG